MHAKRKHGFTLIEMLAAATLSAVLMAAVLMLLGGVNRDVQAMRRADAKASQLDGVFDLIARDFRNAQNVRPISGGVEFTGNIGIDRATLAFDGRLARVSYRVRDGALLRRDQSYLDATDRPQPWSELVAAEVSGISIAPAGNRTRITIATPHGAVAGQLENR